MGHARSSLAAAALAAALFAAPAQAAEVIVVDGERAVRTLDPAVPAPSEIALSAPRVAAPAQAAERRVRTASRAGRRAVARALARELRRKRITSAELRRWRRWYALSHAALRRLRGARQAQLRYVLGSVEALAL